MKKAYFIVGAESSGTLLITRAFCSLGVFGDSGHSQQMDNLVFEGRPHQIVFRRSCPHGDQWPDLANLAHRMIDSGYEVIPVLVLRDEIHNIESQVRKGHASTHRIAHDTIHHAIDKIFRDFSKIGLYPVTVRFESFIRSAEVRSVFFRSLSLPAPEMEFHDSAAKYRTGQDPVIISHL